MEKTYNEKFENFPTIDELIEHLQKCKDLVGGETKVMSKILWDERTRFWLYFNSVEVIQKADSPSCVILEVFMN